MHYFKPTNTSILGICVDQDSVVTSLASSPWWCCSDVFTPHAWNSTNITWGMKCHNGWKKNIDFSIDSEMCTPWWECCIVLMKLFIQKLLEKLWEQWLLKWFCSFLQGPLLSLKTKSWGVIYLKKMIRKTLTSSGWQFYFSKHICWKDMHWVRLKIYILIRFRESTQHTNPKPTKYCLFDVKGLPRKYSQSRKTLKFTSRQYTEPNNFVDQLKVWSSTY